MNGAEIIDQMDRMTMGFWRPSPGSVYPLLEQMESEKLIVKNPDGRYRLTEEAARGPEWMRGFGPLGGRGPRDATEAVGELESYVRFLEDVVGSDFPRIQEVADRLGALARRMDDLAGRARKSG